MPTFGTVHMFCASLDCSRNRVSFKWAVTTIAEVFLKALNWLDLYQRRHYHRCLKKGKNRFVSSHSNLTSLKEKHIKYNTRNDNNFHLPTVRINWVKQRLSFHTVKDWNNLSKNIRNFECMLIFKSTYFSSL